MSDWQFDLEEVGPEAEDDQAIESGTIEIEHVVAVLAGAGLAVGVIVLAL